MGENENKNNTKPFVFKSIRKQTKSHNCKIDTINIQKYYSLKDSNNYFCWTFTNYKIGNKTVSNENHNKNKLSTIKYVYETNKIIDAVKEKQSFNRMVFHRLNKWVNNNGIINRLEYSLLNKVFRVL